MACVSALAKYGKDLTNVREGKELFTYIRDQTRMPKGHPTGQCCICDYDSGVKLKCGHYICPDDILEWSWRQFERLKFEGACAQCEKAISIEDVIKLGLPTNEEEEFITAVVTLNYCESIGMKRCSQCMTYCIRMKDSDVQVKCPICSKKKGKDYWFCWNCDRTWNNPNSHTVCGNKFCNKEVIERLKNCDEIKFTDLRGKIVNTPVERACPQCKTVIHYIDMCNEMICNICQHIFCFICLQSASEGSLICKGRNYTELTCTPAPRQTVL